MKIVQYVKALHTVSDVLTRTLRQIQNDLSNITTEFKIPVDLNKMCAFSKAFDV